MPIADVLGKMTCPFGQQRFFIALLVSTIATLVALRIVVTVPPTGLVAKTGLSAGALDNEAMRTFFVGTLEYHNQGRRSTEQNDPVFMSAASIIAALCNFDPLYHSVAGTALSQGLPPHLRYICSGPFDEDRPEMRKARVHLGRHQIGVHVRNVELDA